MMKKTKLIFLSLLLLSCASGPEPIEYGSDGCDFCKMTIVNDKYGAELVTQKGKVFKFDAVECMINYTKQNAGINAYSFVIDYLNTDQWVPAKEAFYLRSQNLPSPMGQFITAFKDNASAEKVKDEMGGEIQTWEEVVESMNATKIGTR